MSRAYLLTDHEGFRTQRICPPEELSAGSCQSDICRLYQGEKHDQGKGEPCLCWYIATMRCLGKNVAMSYGDGRGFLYSEGMAALLENEYG